MSGGAEEKDRGPLSCAEAVDLLAARRLGDLAPGHPDSARLDRHLAGCAECAGFHALLAGMPELAGTLSLDGMEPAARTAREAYFSRRRTRARLALVAGGIAAAAAAVLLLLPVPAGPPPGPGPEPSPAAIAASGLHLDGAVRVAVEEGGRADAREDAEGLRLRLRAGLLAAEVDPDRTAAREVVVETAAAAVRVTGTIFAVAADGESARVDVLRGTVEVRRAASPGVVIRIGAGRGLELPGGMEGPVPESRRRRIAALLGLPGDGGTAKVSDPAEDAGPQDAAATGGADGGPASGGRAGRVAVRESAEELLDRARRCRIDGDFACARAAYRGIVAAHPRDPAAASALVSLGQIELDRLGLPASARERFSTYLARYPRGPLAAEALFGRARAHRVLGDSGRERDDLRLFLSRFPAGPVAVRARARLAELQAAP